MQKTPDSWIFLSYPQSSRYSSYANRERIRIEQVHSMSNGDSCNTSLWHISSHGGTHMDFPKHFDNQSKSVLDYDANNFIFNTIAIIDISKLQVSDYIIQVEHLNLDIVNTNVELLLLKTGFCDKRFSDEYWEKNWGFHPEVATFLKQKLKNLRAIGFDLMSLSSFQHRVLGREAHKAFLIQNNLWLIEDMDLSRIDAQTTINQVIVSPLRCENTDASPVTVFAKL